MKKKLLTIMLMAAPITMFSQLKVESNGKVVAGTKLFTSSVINYSMHAGRAATGGYNIAFWGETNNTNNTGMAYGIYGKAYNGKYGGNIGVAGVLDSDNYGTGILGSPDPVMGLLINGAYAGYFIGETKVTGTLTANSVVQTSDIRLKENVVPLSTKYNNILDRVLDMNVIEYSYKKEIPSLTLLDSTSTDKVLEHAGLLSNKKHIGLIAQELQELFPTLVEEGQDGYLGVNYVELVPVLVRAIQELKSQVDSLQDNPRLATFRAPSTTGINQSVASDNVLYQNTPNPFNEQTTIRFKLAENVQNATICIFDMTGKMLKKLPVSSGDSSLKVNGWELGEGMFLYSLIINGQVIDTKRMVISK
jgi:hypothetical protein